MANKSYDENSKVVPLKLFSNPGDRLGFTS